MERGDDGQFCGDGDEYFQSRKWAEQRSELHCDGVESGCTGTFEDYRYYKVSKVLLKIGGVPVYQDADGSVHWMGEMTIDADGCPRAYGPEGTEPLDYLANAGYPYDKNDPYGPGNWWGVVTESNGRLYFQDSDDGEEKAPWPDYFLSTTAYLVHGFEKYDARHYVDSEKVCFAVVPGNVRMSIEPKFLGCKVVITDKRNGTELECACCDVGPSNHLGEASIAAAAFFGLDSSPKSGGSSDKKRFHYRMWPGVRSIDYPLQ